MRSLLKTLPRGVLLCKVLFLVICVVYCFDGRHPPAVAQDQQAPTAGGEVYGLEIRSSIQQTRMDNMAEGIVQLKADIKEQRDAVAANTSAIAGMQGENRVIFGILGLLMAGSITLQIRSKRQP